MERYLSLSTAGVIRSNYFTGRGSALTYIIKDWNKGLLRFLFTIPVNTVSLVYVKGTGKYEYRRIKGSN